MKHTKETCLAHHMIISNCCGLACANCGACKGNCNDKPEYGKQYALTGKSGDKCISNENTWKESEIKCPVCDKSFVNGTCSGCDSLVNKL